MKPLAEQVSNGSRVKPYPQLGHKCEEPEYCVDSRYENLHFNRLLCHASNVNIQSYCKIVRSGIFVIDYGLGYITSYFLNTLLILYIDR